MDGVFDNISIESEKHLINSLILYGNKAFFEISDIVTDATFVAETHYNFYKTAEYIFKNNPDTEKIDYLLLKNSAEAIGLKGFFDGKDEKEYLKTLKNCNIELSSAKQIASKLRKLEVTRTIREQLSNVQTRLSNLTGEEKLVDILGIVEQPVFDFGQLIRGSERNEPRQIFKDIKQYIEYVKSNPRQIVGISSPFPTYDRAIGGGFRPGTVSVIASRIKIGKSSIADNAAYHAVSKNIPVLVLDSEMSTDEHYPRMLALISGVKIENIERGMFNSQESYAVDRAGDTIESLPYYYHSTCGEPFEQTVSEMRRWVMSKVGLDAAGNANPCLIIYDYLKLQSSEGLSKNITETIAMGMLTTALVNFCIKYKVPCLTFAQVNRDGIDNFDTTGIIATSDRISWFSSSVSLFRPKTYDEIQEMRTNNIRPYNRAIHFLCSRHGPGLEEGDHLNINFQKDICRMTEGPTHFEMQRNSGNIAINPTNPEF